MQKFKNLQLLNQVIQQEIKYYIKNGDFPLSYIDFLLNNASRETLHTFRFTFAVTIVTSIPAKRKYPWALEICCMSPGN